MSLRVLLADESPSIKKAFELALQDFGVKIQSVHQGVDVKELYESFEPDICFMDILLPKKNGYEACKELKENDSSKTTPVVLMWSGFMELDQKKFKSSYADESIEKPFETQKLRGLVKQLVPKLSQNELSDHLIMEEEDSESDEGSSSDEALSIPSLKDNVDDEVSTRTDLPPLEGTSLDNDDEDDSEILDLPDFDNILDDDDEIEPSRSYSDEPNNDILNFDDIESSDDIDDDWMESPLQDSNDEMDDIESFSLQDLSEEEDLPYESPKTEGENDFSMPEGMDLPPIPVAHDQGESKTNQAHKPSMQSSSKQNEQEDSDSGQISQLKPDVGAASSDDSDSDLPPLAADEEAVKKYTENLPELSKEELKRLILAQSKDIIESVVWDVVPELAKEMIHKEIQRLTGEIKYEGKIG
jgi:twitching motility two-component system response regulator PilG